MPYRNILLISFTVNGHVWRLVQFCWLQNQDLCNGRSNKIREMLFRSIQVWTQVRHSCEVVYYRKTQAVGGSLCGLHDNVHPEVESLSLRRILRVLLLKMLNQLKVLDDWSQVPERGNECELLQLYFLVNMYSISVNDLFYMYHMGGLSLKSFSAACTALGMSLASMLTVKNCPMSQ